MKILIVDDDISLLNILKRHLINVFDDIFISNNYEDAKNLILHKSIDIVVCDHHLSNIPRKQGIDLLENIRKQNITIPFIILTGVSHDEITSWKALNLGSDDFIIKPYVKEDIIARIKLAYRRSLKCKNNSSGILRHKNISLDSDLKKLSINSKTTKLSRILFLLIVEFLKTPNKLISNEHFIEYLWGENALFEKSSINSLRVHVCKLKYILEKGEYIKNIYGLGYIFDEEDY